jgi:hypothetical protein
MPVRIHTVRVDACLRSFGVAVQLQNTDELHVPVFHDHALLGYKIERPWKSMVTRDPSSKYQPR